MEQILSKLAAIEFLLEKLINNQMLQPMSLDKLSEYTGLSKSHIYKLTSQGKIPHYKPTGKIIYFDKKEVDNWLLANKIKLDTEVESISINYVGLKRG